MPHFPNDDLLDNDACLAWLENHLHPEGVRCPRCRAPERRLARRAAAFPAYRCKQCDRFYTVLSGTCFAKTRQTPAKLVLILRGIARGEPTARLARELGLCRRQLHTIRQRVQGNRHEMLPGALMSDPVSKADELQEHAGKDICEPGRARKQRERIVKGSFHADSELL